MRFEAQAVRIFRALLFLYPAEFREHFGRELCLALAGQLRQRGTPAATVATYLTAAANVFIDAPMEHYYMIRQDLTYAWRTMRREKLTTLVAVLVLALGIGPTTAIFTLVDGLLLRPLPFPDQDRLVEVEESLGAVAFPNYLDFQSRNRSLESFALYNTGLGTLQAEGQEAERIPVTIASEHPNIRTAVPCARCAAAAGPDLHRRRRPAGRSQGSPAQPGVLEPPLWGRPRHPGENHQPRRCAHPRHRRDAPGISLPRYCRALDPAATGSHPPGRPPHRPLPEWHCPSARRRHAAAGAIRPAGHHATDLS